MTPDELTYGRPAERWTEALPIGNGSLGAMCHGGVDHDLWQLNADTFWSGGPTTQDVPGAAEAIKAARAELRAERPLAAAAALSGAQGPFVQSYQPLADLHLSLDHHTAPVSGYCRRLDLDEGVAHVSYRVGAVEFTRRSWASHPDGALVVHLGTDGRAALHFSVGLDARLPHTVTRPVPNRLMLDVKAPADVAPHYVDREPAVVHDARDGHGMRAAVTVEVRTDGALTGTDDSIRVTDATAAVLVIVAVTGFQDAFRPPTASALQCRSAASRRLDRLVAKPIESLYSRHAADHRALYRRTSLTLAAPAVDVTTTHELIRAAEHDTSAAVHLTALLFRYGRYLLIASSRPGSQPANLQGIWNRHVRPPWSCNYTLNINTEMNYWPAETTGLPETHEPLLDFLDDLRVTGARTATRNYGHNGWLAHHNSDLWRHSMAVGGGSGDPAWAHWWMGGAWLAHHAYEHAAFSNDPTDLRRAWEILQGAARFLLDWLADDGSGRLGTSPSTSPENTFEVDGQPCAVTESTTMDLCLTAQVFDDLLDVGTRLGVADPLLGRAADARQRLRAPTVGSRGQLLEWDQERPEVDPHHRHVSHLVGVFPGDVLRPSPDLLAAAKVSLDERGDPSTGWSLAWKANLWARLGDGDRAWSLLRRFCTEVTTEEVVEAGGIYANLLCAHPPFQIDGNMGITSAICEMLVDGRGDVLTLLPALPAAWPSGSIRGVRARGGLSVDVTWTDGRLERAVLTSATDGKFLVRHDGAERRIVLVAGVPVALRSSLATSG